MKASVYIATSLDGFIARPDGSLDWLPGSDPNADGGEGPDVESSGEGEDLGWGAFWDSVDCLVFGRKTFEKVLTFGQWPYEGTRVIVLSSNPSVPVPQELQDKVEIYSGDLETLMAKLRSEGYQRLYVDGGQTIQSFLRRGLITDMAITTIPVLIGEGISLFGPLDEDTPLKHIKTEAYLSGFVQSTYEI